MVKFQQTMGGFEVLINDQNFGYIDKEHGFFTDPTVIRKFLTVEPKDLMAIARKAAETKRFGLIPPRCEACKGTPMYPQTVHNPTEGTGPCESEFHEMVRSFELSTV